MKFKTKEERLAAEIKDFCEALTGSKSRIELVGNLFLALSHWENIFNKQHE